MTIFSSGSLPDNPVYAQVHSIERDNAGAEIEIQWEHLDMYGLRCNTATVYVELAEAQALRVGQRLAIAFWTLP